MTALPTAAQLNSALHMPALVGYPEPGRAVGLRALYFKIAASVLRFP